MPGTSDHESRDIAQRIEQDNPRWIVVFGVYTRQFAGFPRFPAPPGTVIAALYPAAMPGRMRELEPPAVPGVAAGVPAGPPVPADDALRPAADGARGQGREVW
jgi:hypothetical protein